MMPHPKQYDDASLDISPDGPVRLCAVTRERHLQSEMVRFARASDGTVTPDIAARLPGRGVWLTASTETLAEATAKNIFSRGFKAQSHIPDGLADLIETLLIKRLQGVLGMAKRAGAIILGYDQVRNVLRKRAPGIVLFASDGAEDGRNKVYFLAKAIYEHVTVSGGLTSTELGMAFGRPNVVHGLIENGAFAKRWSVDYQRLQGFRQTPELSWFSGVSRKR